MIQEIEKTKARGEYRRAGQLARLAGQSDYYGCHYGMRSNREFAIREFKDGWQEIEIALTTQKPGN